MRHVFFATSLTARAQPFTQSAAAETRAVWDSYWRWTVRWGWRAARMYTCATRALRAAPHTWEHFPFLAALIWRKSRSPLHVSCPPPPCADHIDPLLVSLRCKQDSACRPTLCGPSHVTDARWRSSNLARILAQDETAVQWRPPPALGDFSFAAIPQLTEAVPAAARASSPALAVLWRDCRRDEAQAQLSCLRQRWAKNVSSFVGARRYFQKKR